MCDGLFAGSLTPPDPPSPTMKTLSEVEPAIAVQSLPGSVTAVHTITQPGSYYLTGNVTGVAGKHGIEVTTDSVMIDMRGYSLLGVPTSQTGISAETPSNIVVHDGMVSDWGADGINLGSQCQVRNIIATRNQSWGIVCGRSSLVESCTASGNNKASIGNGGIRVSYYSTVHRCVCNDNFATALDGNGIGIDANWGCRIVGNSCSNNGGYGAGWGYGIYLQQGMAIDNECISNRGGGNGGWGIGIYFVYGGTIQGNTCIDNTSTSAAGHAYGIYVSTGHCTVVGNTCDKNQGWAGTSAVACGIRIDDANCRVEGNLCCDNTGATGNYGIWISFSLAAGCSIVRNTLSGNGVGLKLSNTVGNPNYCAENIIHETTAIVEDNPGANTMGTGDRSNVIY